MALKHILGEDKFKSISHVAAEYNLLLLYHKHSAILY